MAPHGVENMNGLFISKIIHDSKYIAAGIKTGQKKLVIVSLKKTVKL